MNMDVIACIKFGIDRVKNNPMFFIGGGLIIGAISFVVNMIGNFVSQAVGVSIGMMFNKLDLPQILAVIASGIVGLGIGLAVGLIAVPFTVGYFKGIMKDYEGAMAEISDIFSAFDIIVPSAINYLIATIIVMAGFVFLIIPGILLSPLPLLVIYFLAKGETQGLDALKKSFDVLLKAPMIILWNIVIGLFGALGLLLCCVGVLFTGPAASCAMFKLCQQATGQDEGVIPEQPLEATNQ